MRPALVFGVLAGLSIILGALSYDLAQNRVDWIETARSQPLEPCFTNHVFVRVQSQIYEGYETMSPEERAELEAAGRIIPEGPHEGAVVPENCFAVATGYYGFASVFWKRPKDRNGQTDMSIPYWTGPEYSRG